jgi:hypothetical protein
MGPLFVTIKPKVSARMKSEASRREFGKAGASEARSKSLGDGESCA